MSENNMYARICFHTSENNVENTLSILKDTSFRIGEDYEVTYAVGLPD